MEHSQKFYQIKEYYHNGLWNEIMVKNAVKKNKITAKEYEEIIGESYQN